MLVAYSTLTALAAEKRISLLAVGEGMIVKVSLGNVIAVLTGSYVSASCGSAELIYTEKNASLVASRNISRKVRDVDINDILDKGIGKIGRVELKLVKSSKNYRALCKLGRCAKDKFGNDLTLRHCSNVFL